MRQVLAARFPFLEIDEVATARDARHHAQASKAGLFFVDVRLPDGNGLELASDLAAAFPQSVICVVTSYDLPEYRRAARNCGACHFLAKCTSTSAQLIEIVDTTLASRVRALIVDDDASRRRAFAEMLSARWPAMIVVEAVDARDGSEKAPALKPDLVFVEVSLLRNAARLCTSVRSVHASSVVIALTGATTRTDRHCAPPGGADRCVCPSDGLDADIAAIVHAASARR